MSEPFDPSAPASAEAGVFGFPFEEEESAVVLLPVPWEVTTSYRGGTASGPAAILEASPQLDFYDLDVVDPYAVGIHMLPSSGQVVVWNERGRERALPILHNDGVADTDELRAARDEVNALSDRLNRYVYAKTRRLLDAKKIVGIVGGDHSVPFGAIEAHAERHPGLGLLHFDAHADTREAYEGFSDSHASIMYNVLERLPHVSKLVQVGVRDCCQQEVDYIGRQGERVRTWFDRELAHRRYRGEPFAETAEAIVAQLPDRVWISFDIDGLDPRHCPNTGTPVPGGLDFNEAVYIIGKVARSGRQILGFDLVEVAPGKDDEWDGNVGARLLYKLIGYTLVSQGRIAWR